MQKLEYDDNLGWHWKNPFKAAYQGVKRGTRAFGRGLKTVASIVPQALASTPGGSLMNGNASISEEELLLGKEGSAERAALERLRGDNVNGVMPNWVPRAQTIASRGRGFRAKTAQDILRKHGYTW